MEIMSEPRGGQGARGVGGKRVKEGRILARGAGWYLGSGPTNSKHLDIYICARLNCVSSLLYRTRPPSPPVTDLVSLVLNRPRYTPSTTLDHRERTGELRKATLDFPAASLRATPE